MTDAIGLTTPLVADACIRLGLPVRCAPPGLGPLVDDWTAHGRVLPARHRGSVDAFLQALGSAKPGDIMVADDGGRRDRGCIGDLVTLEAQAAGLSGIVIWGSHRDGGELRAIGLPVFSLGSHPSGPLDLEPREESDLACARLGEHEVSSGDHVIADTDGAVIVSEARWDDVAAMARRIAKREREQARQVREGRTLRQQFAFDEYLAARARDPALTFRSHLRHRDGAIEE